MFQNIVHGIASCCTGDSKKKIKGTVVLMRKNVLEFNDFHASVLDLGHELLGQGVSLQVISAAKSDPPENGLKEKLGKPANLERWRASTNSLIASETSFEVNFDWEEEIGVPVAILIRNNHHSEFYLKTVTLEDVPGQGRFHFVCNSWIYPAKRYSYDRIFFTSKTCLPQDTDGPLRKYREEELVKLRGDGKGELKEWDRVYDYAYYNDLGDPDEGTKYVRPVLGGSSEYPYPRRGRTGRAATESDPNTESRLPLLMGLNIYVPRDERFGHLRMADFLGYALKLVAQVVKPGLEGLFDSTPLEFDSFDDVFKLYEGGIELPQVIEGDKTGWRTDEEFSREMLAGLNPVVIRRLEEFPPKSKLDSKQYGDQNSKITEEDIKNNLEGLATDEAIKKNRMFILDHHDALMPYLRRINTPSKTTYATRTLLFLKDDGTLKPLAIELSLPHEEGDEFGAVSKVYTPAEHGVEGSIWQLAKAYVGVNDSGYHQLISHWLHTHAAIEPFVIATNRHLSVLINAGGALESTVYPMKYALEISSSLYKSWDFTQQALPEDLKGEVLHPSVLIKANSSGVAVEDPNSPHGVRLLIEDYPYAVDGLEIWSAIKEWVKDYCSFYYKTDDSVRKDSEIQSWWKEVREVGHGDLKDAPWWPKMQTREELIESCTIIIWVGSALHAAINFGQYPYGGFLPNRPSMSRRLIPEKGSAEYEELESNPDKAFLKTITSQYQTLLGISLIEILSRHTSDEVYLGQRDTPEWTADSKPMEALDRFRKKLTDIEKRIFDMNKDDKLKNRFGPVKMPYTLLVPTSKAGLTGRGIPNSVSI
ncbi:LIPOXYGENASE [Salix koriyanagi]|uniref:LIPOXYGENASE n=1 Tax=Salix koriyanagi TaxID=2511006 RepID=A0A9Q0P7D1_9ROSI|nr:LIPOXYGENASE [Salix koriyanagi]